MDFFSTLPGIIVTISGVIAGSVMGLFYFINILKGKKDESASKLIGILQNTVNELERKVNQQNIDIEKQTIDIASLSKKIETLQKENKFLIAVLQGKDKSTQEFQKNMLETKEIVNDTNEKIGKLLETIGVLHTQPTL